jgi:regulator of protease activity HflC (stomatin/prohibitin superfamily)
MTGFNILVWLILFLITAVRLVGSIRMVPNRREYIVERLGKYQQTLGPGFHVLVPFVDRVRFIHDLREESMEVPPQECFTADNVKVEVDGVIYISITDAKAASYGVTNYRRAAVSLAQTTTRSVIGTLDLDRTFEERDAINARVVAVLSEVGPSWGIRVHRYEVKNIMTPPTIRESMERQMAAERERRAVIARSEGEKQSRINDSEGRRTERINQAEGEKQRRINEADGRAAEVRSLAEATAHSIRQVAGAVSRPGGTDAMRLDLSQRWLTGLRGLAMQEARVVLPMDLSNPAAVLDRLGLPSGDNAQLVAASAGRARPVSTPLSVSSSAPPPASTFQATPTPVASAPAPAPTWSAAPAPAPTYPPAPVHIAAPSPTDDPYRPVPGRSTELLQPVRGIPGQE